ncbi:MAG: hypothetical protein GXO85_07850 [Chlorobi bacterium]|nr:hypothetical protein [Chlorobiota bacterium]
MERLIILIINLFASTVLFAQVEFDSQTQNSSIITSLAFAPTTSDSILNESDFQEIPTINVGDIASQLLLSPISGMIFAVLGGLGGYVIEPSSHGGPSLPVVIGTLAGYSVGSGIGVYAVSRRDKYDPDLMALIGSSLLGEIAGVFIFKYVNEDYSTNPNVLEYAPLFLPPIFAMVTLNAFQQKKTNITIGFDIHFHSQMLIVMGLSYNMLYKLI